MQNQVRIIVSRHIKVRSDCSKFVWMNNWLVLHMFLETLHLNNNCGFTVREDFMSLKMNHTTTTKSKICMQGYKLLLHESSYFYSHIMRQLAEICSATLVIDDGGDVGGGIQGVCDGGRGWLWWWRRGWRR